MDQQIAEYIFQNNGNRQHEYLLARYDYIGRGITGEFNFLDINGERVITHGGKGDVELWGDRESIFFAKLAAAGWRLVSHSVQDQPEGRGTTFHYAKFERVIG